MRVQVDFNQGFSASKTSKKNLYDMHTAGMFASKVKNTT